MNSQNKVASGSMPPEKPCFYSNAASAFDPKQTLVAKEIRPVCRIMSFAGVTAAYARLLVLADEVIE